MKVYRKFKLIRNFENEFDDIWAGLRNDSVNLTAQVFELSHVATESAELLLSGLSKPGWSAHVIVTATLGARPSAVAKRSRRNLVGMRDRKW